MKLSIISRVILFVCVPGVMLGIAVIIAFTVRWIVGL